MRLCVARRATQTNQRTVGLTFRRFRTVDKSVHVSDILVDEPAHLPSLSLAFIAAAKQAIGGDLTATSVPAEVTLAVRPESLGFCTARYDVGPGAVGAPVIWVPHQDIARTYRPEFRRLLSPLAEGRTAATAASICWTGLP